MTSKARLRSGLLGLAIAVFAPLTGQHQNSGFDHIFVKSYLQTKEPLQNVLIRCKISFQSNPFSNAFVQIAPAL